MKYWALCVAGGRGRGGVAGGRMGANRSARVARIAAADAARRRADHAVADRAAASGRPSRRSRPSSPCRRRQTRTPTMSRGAPPSRNPRPAKPAGNPVAVAEAGAAPQAGGAGPRGGLRAETSPRIPATCGSPNPTACTMSNTPRSAGDDGSTLMASVLFPNDPKRRLEVLWDDDIAAHRHPHDRDRRPVHLDGPEGGPPRPAAGGAGEAQRQAVQADGLREGRHGDRQRLERRRARQPDRRLQGRGAAQAGPEGARQPRSSAVGSDKEFASGDPAIRAAKPTVGEIIVAY